MLKWWKDLDRILRGEATRLPALRRGTIEVPLGGLSAVLAILAIVYGACMGSFAVFRAGLAEGSMQLIASMVKLPALFVLTLIVTFPSLYVFNALVGSRLTINAMLRLLVAALAVTVAVLASLGPIVAFFSASTTSYPFILLLNVAVFAASGLLGMAFLLQTLHRLSLIEPEPEPAPAASPESAHDPLQQVAHALDEAVRTASQGTPAGALEAPDERMLSRHVKVVFRCWIFLFGLVGAQMGWVLRPFVGNPAVSFSWLRPRESNVFQGILNALATLF